MLQVTPSSFKLNTTEKGAYVPHLLLWVKTANRCMRQLLQAGLKGPGERLPYRKYVASLSSPCQMGRPDTKSDMVWLEAKLTVCNILSLKAMFLLTP